MSICVKNCVQCNWLWCFGNTVIQSAVDSPHKKPLILRLDVFYVVSLSKRFKQQSVGVEKHRHVLFVIYDGTFYQLCWEDLPGCDHICFLYKCWDKDLL